MQKVAIIVAAGSGNRMNSKIPKQFLLLNNIPVLMHTINLFYAFDKNIQILLALSKNDADYWKELCFKYDFRVKHQIIFGGKTRFNSVKNCIKYVHDEQVVGIHDGVRPCVSQETLQSCYATAKELGNAIPVLEVKDSLRMITQNGSKQVLRSDFRIVQTPQVFIGKILRKAYKQDYQALFTDDASVVEAVGEHINLVPGNAENIKITTPFDLQLAVIALKQMNQ